MRAPQNPPPVPVPAPQPQQQNIKNELDELQKHVKKRKAAIDKKNYKEKVASEFQPCAIVERYGELEECMWRDSDTRNRRSIVTALRHRYCVSHLTAGLLRTESLHRAELSDFCAVVVPPKMHSNHGLWKSSIRRW